MKLNMLGFLGFLGLLGSLGSTENAALYGLYPLFARTQRSILHAGTIGSAAAILVVVQMTLSGAGIHMVIPVVVSIAAGLVGGIKRVLRATAQ